MAQLIPITTKSDLEKLLDLLINSVATLLILAEHNFPSLRRAASYRVTDIQWEPDSSGRLTLAQSRDWGLRHSVFGFLATAGKSFN